VEAVSIELYLPVSIPEVHGEHKGKDH
jgi:hypothetical protein